MLLLTSLAFLTFWNPYATDQYNWLQYIHPLDRYQNTYQVAQQGFQYVNTGYTDVRQFIHPLDGGTSRYPAVAGVNTYSNNYYQPYTYPTPLPPTPTPQVINPIQQCQAAGGYWAMPECLVGTPVEQCQGRCYMPTR